MTPAPGSARATAASSRGVVAHLDAPEAVDLQVNEAGRPSPSAGGAGALGHQGPGIEAGGSQLPRELLRIELPPSSHSSRSRPPAAGSANHREPCSSCR